MKHPSRLLTTSSRPTRGLWSLLRGAANDFVEDDVMSLAAATAFYTAVSFAPLVMLVMNFGGLLGEGTQTRLVQLFTEQMGADAQQIAEGVVRNVNDNQGNARSSSWHWIVSTVVLVFTVSGVFAQLQASLNHIWDVEAKPERGLWRWLRKRLLSIGMVFAIFFILLVSLVLSTFLELFIPSQHEFAGRVGSFLASFLVSMLLFAAIFKVLPDARIGWRDVWFGAAVTAGLFSVGKLAISLYLAHGGVTDGYGKAAGSLIALLVWVYYSCIIVFVGAEIAQQHSKRSEATALPLNISDPRQHGS